VTAVRPGSSFAVGDGGEATIRIDQQQDLTALLAGLPNEPRTIVHGFSLAGSDADADADSLDAIGHFGAEQGRGFYFAMALARALTDDTGTAPRTELVLLTSGATAVLGSDLAHPEHSTLAALAPSLAQENPRLRCRSVDVDAPPAGERRALSRLSTQLLIAAVTPHEGPVAIRAGELWLRRYQPMPVEEPTPGELPIRDGDVVLITGGLGDVGLLLSRHLASRYHCKLVLTARSELPPREQWQEYLDAVPEGGERAARHIANILDLERRGAEVIAVSADVADLEQMRALVEDAVRRFGGIDVVVHAAGVQNSKYFNFAHLIDQPSCEAHFAAKVAGFHVLQEVLGERALDRRITLSSLAAVLGGMTLAPYACANAALDAYARQARTAGAGNWITVDWDTWNIDPERLQNHGPGITDYAMAPAEAVDMFERTLAAGDHVGHLVISTGPLGSRLEQWVTGDLHADAGQDDQQELHPRPELNTPFSPPREGTETVLADIWSRVLGIEPIGSDDNFFELGGHSLIAIDLTGRIRKALGAAIPVTGLLEYPTVRQLAELIDSTEAGVAEEEGDHATA
jgi:NAD(P)-dependent dehydrogenase (short-subunit alcohol dehydrogenase family)/acyl carrier protein